MVVRRFIAVFYPDCLFDTTTVIGEADQIAFKTSGKIIKEEGWRVVFQQDEKHPNFTADASDDSTDKEEETHPLPQFKKGESGPHEPLLTEKWTQPPRPYTEATLLRAMETAGKLVNSDELGMRSRRTASGVLPPAPPSSRHCSNGIISVRNAKT